MTADPTPLTILCADDDPDDQLLTRDAITESGIHAKVRFVTDGEELLAYLRRTGRFATLDRAPAPSLILLDLNMPRMGGREALRVLKGDDELKHIPTVVLTNSRAHSDINGSYHDGAHSYVVKPLTHEAFVGVVRDLPHHWPQLVERPGL